MMSPELSEVYLFWFWVAMGVWGLVCLIFGAFSAVWPRRSISLYQKLMARINWSVHPIDEAREIVSTRRLGLLLLLLTTFLAFLFFLPQP